MSIGDDTTGAPGQTNGNGEAPGDGSQMSGPRLSVTGQYVKDFSFENPNAPESLANDGVQPQIEVNVDVRARGVQGDMYEVVLHINAKCEKGGQAAFVIELDYAGLFVLQGFQQDQLEMVCLIECPRMLFPFARQIIANTVRDGGYAPLLLDPIDFAELYRRSREAQLAGLQDGPNESADPS